MYIHQEISAERLLRPLQDVIQDLSIFVGLSKNSDIFKKNRTS